MQKVIGEMWPHRSAKEMRVAFFPGFLGPKGGGATRSACMMASGLAACGIQVFIEGLQDNDSAGLLSELPLDGCEVHSNAVVMTDRGLQSDEIVARLISLVPNLDVVHLNGHWDPLNHTLAQICVSAGVPYIISARSTVDPITINLLSYETLTALKTAEHLYVANAWAVHVTSSIEARRARFEVLPQRLLNICNPVELDYLRQIPSREMARTTLDIPCDQIALLYYGRLITQKQPEFALLVLSQFPRYENVHLYFVGLGSNDEVRSVLSLANALEVQRQVHIMGYVSGAPKVCWLAAADVLLLPSLVENFSLGLVEGVAAGLSAIVSPNVGALEFLEPQDTTVVPLDPKRWADACASLYQFAANRGSVPFTRLQSLFHPKRVAQEWIHVYEQLLT